jgi:hypothetical protein
MSRKRYRPEQILGMLRQSEVELAQGKRAESRAHARKTRDRDRFRWSQYLGRKFRKQ